VARELTTVSGRANSSGIDDTARTTGHVRGGQRCHVPSVRATGVTVLPGDFDRIRSN
jgi:hypothetical protein